MSPRKQRQGSEERVELGSRDGSAGAISTHQSAKIKPSGEIPIFPLSYLKCIDLLNEHMKRREHGKIMMLTKASMKTTMEVSQSEQELWAIRNQNFAKLMVQNFLVKMDWIERKTPWTCLASSTNNPCWPLVDIYPQSCYSEFCQVLDKMARGDTDDSTVSSLLRRWLCRNHSHCSDQYLSEVLEKFSKYKQGVIIEIEHYKDFRENAHEETPTEEIEKGKEDDGPNDNEAAKASNTRDIIRRHNEREDDDRGSEEQENRKARAERVSSVKDTFTPGRQGQECSTNEGSTTSESNPLITTPLLTSNTTTSPDPSSIPVQNISGTTRTQRRAISNPNIHQSPSPQPHSRSRKGVGSRRASAPLRKIRSGELGPEINPEETGTAGYHVSVPEATVTEFSDQVPSSTVTPPSNKVRSPRDTSSVATSFTGCEPFEVATKPPGIADSVLRLILEDTKTKTLDEGYIYTCAPISQPGYVKIGRTTQKMKTRQKQIENCLSVKIESVDDTHCKFRFHSRAERLILTDLGKERRKIPCRIPTHNHGEWMELDVDTAKAYVEIWRSWMQTHPYAEDGKLRKKWMRRAAYFTKNVDAQKSLLATHDSKKRWADFMRPSIRMRLRIRIWFLLHEPRQSLSESVRGARMEDLYEALTWCLLLYIFVSGVVLFLTHSLASSFWSLHVIAHLVVVASII